MAKLDVAARADLALVLPGLVLARHLHDAGFLPDLETCFHGACTLDDDSYMRLTPVHGETVVDTDVVDFLSTVAVSHCAVQAANWVHKLGSYTSKNRRQLEQALVDLDVHLTMRTYLVGQHLSVSDLPVWAALRSNPVALSLIRKVDGNVLRWYNFVDASNPWLSELVSELTAPAARERAQARAAASAAGASYDMDMDLPDLEGDGPVVTRFAPEPSGYLHIGHAKAALLNDYFAHRRPGGRLICRFDDTNPAKESMEFQDAILADLAMIGIVPDTTSYASDYFQCLHDLAVQLIEDGKAFADDAELGKGNAERKNLQPSARRAMGVAETLAHFAEMRAGTAEGARWCLRARIAYDSPHGTLRDPVIYRCNATPHHRTGTRWKMYPTCDFCVPILDALEGVTLALRTNEYRDRNVQYAWFQQALGLRAVPIYDFSRMSFARTLLSKRTLAKIVEEGRVWGWDDPRMPTIRGVLRRGVAVAALREFVLQEGPSLEWGPSGRSTRSTSTPWRPATRPCWPPTPSPARCAASGPATWRRCSGRATESSQRWGRRRSGRTARSSWTRRTRSRLRPTRRSR